MPRRTPWLAVVAIGVLVLAAAAVQAATGPAIQTSTPSSADDVTNVDVLKQQIRNYYGDPLGTRCVRSGQQLRQGSRRCRG